MGKLIFWLNAFIPRNVAGYTKEITTGKHKGKTAVPLPTIARFHPFNTFKDWNAGYLTDQRGFDQRYGASSRMTSMLEIDTDTLKFTEAHTSSGTTQVNIASGSETGFDTADMKRSYFQQVRIPQAHTVATGTARYPKVNYPGYRPIGVNALRFNLYAAAGDPLVWAAADINYEGEVNVHLHANGVIFVMFDGKIDEFPAYDCYISYGGKTATVFTSSPPKGNTVADLLGSANRSIRGRAQIP